ncbi:unnamed protein product [Gongylonema pulchrum]|uniref:Similar to n=1 Tax=Gongylonema pulchrum TaxID=637853 RepID=A0A183D0W6_9BILA|nr:unnamed protein product [Gongylonema pulchrum]
MSDEGRTVDGEGKPLQTVAADENDGRSGREPSRPSPPAASSQSERSFNLITPPAAAASDETHRAPLAEPETTEQHHHPQHHNPKHRESIWDTYVQMTDDTVRKRRMSRRQESLVQAEHLASLGEPLIQEKN